MSQNDFTIANQTFPNTRADINSALQALASTSSGSSAPSTTFANQFFYNTTSNLLQIRNEGNDAYIILAELDQTADNVEYFKSTAIRLARIEFEDGDDALTIADGGGVTVHTSLDMNGTELILDADADTSITADTDDRIDLRVGGADVAHITKNVIGGIINRENATPFLINGDFKIAQRATSVSGINAAGLAVVDRWGYVIGDAGTWTAERANDGPADNGFPQCFKWDVTTAKGTLGANTIMYIRQILEAQDVQLFNIAQSTARPFTVTFWVRSTKTGTYICMLNNFTANRHVSKAYTISSSNTWEKKTVSFPADTGGSIGNTEGAGISVNFWMTAGSTYSSGTLQQTWGSAVAANQAVGQVNAADSTSNFFSLAGVQLEVGEYDAITTPPFQHESYGDSLLRCQRYFQNIEAARANTSGFGHVESTTIVINLPLALKPRILARYDGSGTFTKVGDIAVNAFPTGADNITGISTWIVMGNMISVGMTSSGSMTSGSSEPVRFASASPQTIFTLDTEL